MYVLSYLECKKRSTITQKTTKRKRNDNYRPIVLEWIRPEKAHFVIFNFSYSISIMIKLMQTNSQWDFVTAQMILQRQYVGLQKIFWHTSENHQKYSYVRSISGQCSIFILPGNGRKPLFFWRSREWLKSNFSIRSINHLYPSRQIYFTILFHFFNLKKREKHLWRSVAFSKVACI